MNTLKKLSLALVLMMLLCVSATAQTSQNSTPANDSASASEQEAIAQLAAEVKAGRALIVSLRAERDAFAAQAEVERKNASSIQRSYDAAQTELASKDRAIEALTRAVSLHEKTIAMLAERERVLSKEVKKQKKHAVIAALVAVGTIASKFLL
jgi:chromosome segregation ATPase